MNRRADNWDYCLEQASLSDVGLRRANNQDSKAVVMAGGVEKWRQRGHLFMVADGMGAHAAGELASKLATDMVPLTYYKLKDEPAPEALQHAVEDANRQIHTRGEANLDFKGMGTTVSTLVLLPQGAVVAHVGDSRAYRLRNRRLEQLTFDHSLVWEIRAAEHMSENEVPDYIPKNVITRSLGPNPNVRVDLEGPFPVEIGDIFLLCSDGLSGPVTDEEIGKIIGCLPPEEAVHALVDLANLRGGPDNITVVVVRVTGPESDPAAARHSANSTHGPAGQSVHPALSILLAVLVAATLGCGLLAFKLRAVGYALAAAASGIGALIAGIVAMNPPSNEGTTNHKLNGRPLGKGPYVSLDCTADAGFVDRLSGIIERLRELAGQNGWTIDWDHFNALNAQAVAAADTADYPTAVRKSCHAISFLVSQLRSQ